jgi:hypothetical protein
MPIVTYFVFPSVHINSTANSLLAQSNFFNGSEINLQNGELTFAVTNNLSTAIVYSITGEVIAYLPPTVRDGYLHVVLNNVAIKSNNFRVYAQPSVVSSALQNTWSGLAKTNSTYLNPLGFKRSLLFTSNIDITGNPNNLSNNNAVLTPQDEENINVEDESGVDLKDQTLPSSEGYTET